MNKIQRKYKPKKWNKNKNKIKVIDKIVSVNRIIYFFLIKDKKIQKS